ncbi:MAG: alkaline phosphatase family protein [Lentimicrobiaceae bacterium]|jgi:alkaline phosphatase D|nr:alkaline phosphatase family protein [Lentimicrobiaceae bacterium]MCP4909067.1 alkaline phosphatase family protein [Bacteroidota bacterium]MBT4060899.1 alkaline phosphatase family protein [Lentimicrobiaceae bacterium]MBT6015971.1 alkaline phosphatase family protein [Lentimicrobiaceae bacterium]MBT6673141.1 alkaline phosphatase family protein [Lentimicrobiaceae bacterium]
MKFRVSLIAIIMVLSTMMCISQNELLQSGPMVGYSEMLEVPVWVQTKKAASVTMKYWNAENSDNIYMSNIFKTKKDDAFTALLIADSVTPGNKYFYDIYIDDEEIVLPYEKSFQTQSIWKWRTDPPNFSFVMGSGTYINEDRYDRPGKRYGDGYQIFNSMLELNPDFMLWLGDNVYLREPDWNSKTGIYHRYTHSRSTPEMQAFLASTHNYAILDDHDFGPNDSDRGFWNKNETLKAFELFWANPSYGVGDINGAITSFQWGDADFFLLDNRTYRSPDKRKTGEKTQLGEDQLQWLFDNLSSSQGTFKFVVMGGQFLSTSPTYESYTNYGFDKERKRIINYIYEENIKNVVFLTGDVHFSEVAVLRKKGMPTIWDITSSPLNSGVNTKAKEKNNTLRIDESVIIERNFAELKLSGIIEERIIDITYFDGDGNKIWNYSISRE